MTYSNVQIPMQEIKDQENQVNRTIPKESNKTLITDTEEMEIYNYDKELIHLKKFCELQEHTERQINKIRKTDA